MRDDRILVATTNRGKLHEIGILLNDKTFNLVRPPEIGLHLEVEEDADTYAGNATLKALAYANASGLISLGDDSGLEVDALDGAPGIRAARFAGPGATDADRYNLLLSQLEGVPMERRTAKFRCAVAVATPDGRVETAEGACDGRIAFKPAGNGGFGYDPIFYMDEFGCTMAELPEDIKNTLSHRARAFAAARPLMAAALARWTL